MSIDQVKKEEAVLPRVVDSALVVASDIFRKKWRHSGKDLRSLASDINQACDGCSGFDRDNLWRSLHAGREGGIQSYNLFLRSLSFLSEYYVMDRREIRLRIGEEKLRLHILAQLEAHDASSEELIEALKKIMKDDSLNTVQAWLTQNDEYSEIYSLAAPIAKALRNILGDSSYTASRLREIIEFP